MSDHFSHAVVTPTGRTRTRGAPWARRTEHEYQAELGRPEDENREEIVLGTLLIIWAATDELADQTVRQYLRTVAGAARRNEALRARSRTVRIEETA